MTIPKNIYQVFIGYDKPLPKQIIKNIEFIKKQNPKYSYTLLRDKDVENFIKKEYNEFILELYLSINPDYSACRVDFFRYLLINKVGGIYLDLKSAPLKPLDEVIDKDDEIILSYCEKPKLASFIGPKGELQMFWLISNKNNPFLDKVIKNVIMNILTYYDKRDVGYRGVWRISGPIVFTKTIENNLNLYKYRLVKEFMNKLNVRGYKKIYDKPHYTILTTPIITRKFY